MGTAGSELAGPTSWLLAQSPALWLYSGAMTKTSGPVISNTCTFLLKTSQQKNAGKSAHGCSLVPVVFLSSKQPTPLQKKKKTLQSQSSLYHSVGLKLSSTSPRPTHTAALTELSKLYCKGQCRRRSALLCYLTWASHTLWVLFRADTEGMKTYVWLKKNTFNDLSSAAQSVGPGFWNR